MAELRRQDGSEDNPGLINHKFLQRARIFFNHLGMTIDFLPPALKGLHNVIDGWREGRDEDRFRDKNMQYQDVLDALFLLVGCLRKIFNA